MTRLFGTDGIRGVANLDLRPSLAFALGRATAHQVVGAGGTLNGYRWGVARKERLLADERLLEGRRRSST